MMRRLILITASLAVSSGCGEVETDTGEACVIPVGSICDCAGAEFTICGSAPDSFGDGGGFDCTNGELPAESPLRIEIWLGTGRGDSWDLECSVEQTGDHELSIQSSFRWRPDKNADIEPDLFVACQTPPLTAGEWTVRYGEGERKIEVGTSDAPLTCIDSGKDRE